MAIGSAARMSTEPDSMVGGFSRSVLSNLGVAPDEVASIINSFAADDYAVMRGVGGVGPQTAPERGQCCQPPGKISCDAGA
jgi:hypothetical protein